MATVAASGGTLTGMATIKEIIAKQLGRVVDLPTLVKTAGDLGHTAHVERRDFDEYNSPPKFKFTCTCGYEAANRRSEKAALEVAVFHLAYVVGKELGPVRSRNGGTDVSEPAQKVTPIVHDDSRQAS